MLVPITWHVYLKTDVRKAYSKIRTKFPFSWNLEGDTHTVTLPELRGKYGFITAVCLHKLDPKDEFFESCPYLGFTPRSELYITFRISDNSDRATDHLIKVIEKKCKEIADLFKKEKAEYAACVSHERKLVYLSL